MNQINKVIIATFQSFPQHVPNYSFQNFKTVFQTIWQLLPTLANGMEFFKNNLICCLLLPS